MYILKLDYPFDKKKPQLYSRGLLDVSNINAGFSACYLFASIRFSRSSFRV